LAQRAASDHAVREDWRGISIFVGGFRLSYEVSRLIRNAFIVTDLHQSFDNGAR